MGDNHYRVYAPAPGSRYYVGPRVTITGFYGSSLKISIPEPDGEMMLTVLDHNGHEVTDIYVDSTELVRAITQIEEAYEAIPEEARTLPTRPMNKMSEVEGSHP